MAHRLTPEGQDEGRRIEDRRMGLVRSDLRDLAEMLASTPDRQLLGRAEFEVRDRGHRTGAEAIEPALAAGG